MKFIENMGDFFSGNYFSDDFHKKVIEKSGYCDDDLKSFETSVRALKEKYYLFKKEYLELSRCKDQIERTHKFHSLLLNTLGYNLPSNDYSELFHLTDTEVVPVRHKLNRGVDNKPHLFIMEMKAMIKKDEEEPKGLFEQRWHRAQWEMFQIQDGETLTPSIINEAINEIFLIDQHARPIYILLLAGNEIYLLHYEKWFKGSYLRIKLEELFDEATLHRDYYQLFYLLLSKDILAPDADIMLMDQLEEDSHKSAYAVTKDLKEGIINAVELLANEALYYKKTILGEDFDESDDVFEQQIKDDCLTIIYRLLFVFYAESRPELGILPTNDSVYTKGYSLDMLRELEQVKLNSQSSKDGYFFNDSLLQLFALLNDGYRTDDVNNKSFTISRLDTPLFDDNKFFHLKGIKFRNYIWQDIICQLSLSQKKNGRARGRISYANLGINQLGSVYEGLLAYRGFYAEQDYIEVHTAGNPNEGTFVVPRSRIDDFEHDEILKDEDDKVKFLPKGTFVYRLSGRDRQQSASYYTPEVLTRTTVKYTLKSILERLDKKEIKADDLLNLKILEPAQGASAFQNEVINQIAEAYVNYKQIELNKRVPAKDYQDQLQRVKAYVATNNVYGVDINPTAIELGKLSLWLNVIHKDMEVPYFGYRLGVGNAVVGAWLKVYKKEDVIFTPIRPGSRTAERREWWEQAPVMRSYINGKLCRKENEIYHFLLPDKNMVPSAGIRMLKDEYPNEARHVTEWKREFISPIRGDEFIKLQNICKKIDALLEEHYDTQNLINEYTGGKKNFFGHEVLQKEIFTAYNEKDHLAQQRNKHNAPYYKLKMIMDYWCALWFWDVRNAADLPSRSEWYTDIANILELDLSNAIIQEQEDELLNAGPKQGSLFSEPKQHTLKTYRDSKKKEISIEFIKKYTDRTDLFQNDRLTIVKDLSTKYRFFHNQLEFIEVFKQKGGFDVVVGNPPWLKVLFEEKDIISEKYPEVEIRSISAPEIRSIQSQFLQNVNLRNQYFDEYIGTESTSIFLNAHQNYPLLIGQQTNLYKCVIENGFNIVQTHGYMGLLHPEGVYDDPNGRLFRKAIYRRLKYHFQFKNALTLFSEVKDQKLYSINIYSELKDLPSFFTINNLFHPSTIDGCFSHNGGGDCGGIKIKNDSKEGFTWNIKPHADRKVQFTKERLQLITKLFESSDEWEGAKLVSIHADPVIRVLNKLSSYTTKINEYETKITVCLDETNDVTNGTIKRFTTFPRIENDQMIYSGPHLFVSNPLYKTPREVCTEKAHYDVIDHNLIDEEFLPRTNYVPCNSFDVFKKHLNGFRLGKKDSDGNYVFDNWLDYYKIGFRKMLNHTGDRTLNGSILPPNSTHINGVITLTLKNQHDLVEFAGLVSSLVLDFLLKTIGAANLTDSRLNGFPMGVDIKYKRLLSVRTLILNCLNKHYSVLWENQFDDSYCNDEWSINDIRLKPFRDLKKCWDWSTPLRNAFERRLALVEIDVITAMALGLTLEELILIYNVQFPVLQQNEDDTWYDHKGNIVFTCSKGLVGVGLDRPDWERVKDKQEGDLVTHTITKSELYRGKQITYYPPFTKCDRVEDYKRAWAFFEERFNK